MGKGDILGIPSNWEEIETWSTTEEPQVDRVALGSQTQRIRRSIRNLDKRDIG